MENSSLPDDPKEQVIMKLGLDRELAHRTLFVHRHPIATPLYHRKLIKLWHGDDPQVLTEVFRGGAKSSLAEEAICIMACLRQFKNCIVGGENEPRAIERLAAIKHELEHNEMIEELFGTQVGSTWAERKIVLANGTCIQALGRGQSMRGTKHLQYRPDLFFGDDLEDEECVATPEAREAFMHWFLRVVRPALAKKRRIRIAGTRLDPESFIAKLENSPHWVSVKVPWESLDATGKRVATWPEMFDLDYIDKTKDEYTAGGDLQGYMQEYMCEATSPLTQTFTREMIRVEPSVRVWQATYCCFDPARTVRARSALTGWATWSWVGPRLVVWDSGGGQLMPDQIINKMFEINDLYEPVHVGVEVTGLSEFINQPLRIEQVRRNITIPIKPLEAPKGKIDFIKGLQPLFKSGQAVLAKPQPELEQQMLSFPTGKIDTLNALAYALKMRPGNPVYDNFRQDIHIVESFEHFRRVPFWLAVNATSQVTTAALCQFVKGSLHVSDDWVCEGDPGSQLSDIVRDASMRAQASLRVVCGPAHFGDHDTVGMRGAGHRIPVEFTRGGRETEGREGLRRLMRESSHGQPALLVAHGARWVLNGLSGGYCYPVTKHGTPSEFTDPGPYKVLMEGLEQFAALLDTGQMEGDDERNFAYTAQGRRYLSALAR